MKPKYNHLSHGATVCTLEDKHNNKVYGYAQLHPEEVESSARVGEYIATIRAEIAYYKFIRRNELMPKIKILNHLLSCINNTNSKKYNPKSAEATLIKRQYWLAKSDYDATGELI